MIKTREDATIDFLEKAKLRVKESTLVFDFPITAF